MKLTDCIVMTILLSLACVPALAKDKNSIPRTASGHPDLSGNYDAATLRLWNARSSSETKPF